MKVKQGLVSDCRQMSGKHNGAFTLHSIIALEQLSDLVCRYFLGEKPKPLEQGWTSSLTT